VAEGAGGGVPCLVVWWCYCGGVVSVFAVGSQMVMVGNHKVYCNKVKVKAQQRVSKFNNESERGGI